MNVRSSNVVSLAAALSMVALIGEADAQGLSPGTYRCTSYNVSGAGGSCTNMPRLVLHPDGSYQFSTTQGEWHVRADSLRLSASTLWGPGALLGSNEVRFTYAYRGMEHVVTWLCQACTEMAMPDSTGSAPASGTPVGVTLTLVFDTDVGGVSAFEIVPAEAARTYVHDGPLPHGAVQGLARAVGASSVAVATGATNKVASGRRYVVFLDWLRETIAVAILDLPPMTDDYEATLQATLDGPSVLARLDR